MNRIRCEIGVAYTMLDYNYTYHKFMIYFQLISYKFEILCLYIRIPEKFAEIKNGNCHS